MTTAEKSSQYHVTIYLFAEHKEESISVAWSAHGGFRGDVVYPSFLKNNQDYKCKASRNITGSDWKDLRLVQSPC